MDVSKTIVKTLNGHIFSLSEKISQKYDTPLEEILQIWCEQENVNFTTVFSPMIKIAKKIKKGSVIIQPEISTEDVINNDTERTSTILEEDLEEDADTANNMCVYIFTRGPKKNQRCTIIAKNGALCSKHKK